MPVFGDSVEEFLLHACLPCNNDRTLLLQQLKELCGSDNFGSKSLTTNCLEED